MTSVPHLPIQPLPRLFLMPVDSQLQQFLIETPFCLHCLSAFCAPLERIRGSLPLSAHSVSIAFRHSAPTRPSWQAHLYSAQVYCLHCLSASCPPVTGSIGLSALICSIVFPLPFGVLSPGHVVSWQHVNGSRQVTIAYRRSVPRSLRLPNCLAGRGRRAVQVTTAAMSQLGSRWSLPVRGDKLHKELRCGKLKFS